MYEPTETDFQILRYIAKHGSTSISQLESRFPAMESLEYRVRQMATPQSKSSGSGHSSYRVPIPNTSYLLEDYRDFKDGPFTKVEYLGTFHLTEFGRKAIQDHTQSTKSARKELWLKNAWIPIIVAFVTTVLTNYLIPKLPQILEWLSSILQRIFS